MSGGPKRAITKAVRSQEVNAKDLYNIDFGDKGNGTGFINDIVVTYNGDSQKVLATVVRTLYHFTDHYPNASIIAAGSSSALTHLYRMGITTNLVAAEQYF